MTNRLRKLPWFECQTPELLNELLPGAINMRDLLGVTELAVTMEIPRVESVLGSDVAKKFADNGIRIQPVFELKFKELAKPIEWWQAAKVISQWLSTLHPRMWGFDLEVFFRRELHLAANTMERLLPQTHALIECAKRIPDFGRGLPVTVYPGSWGYGDARDARTRWFTECLHWAWPSTPMATTVSDWSDPSHPIGDIPPAENVKWLEYHGIQPVPLLFLLGNDPDQPVTALPRKWVPREAPWLFQCLEAAGYDEVILYPWRHQFKHLAEWIVHYGALMGDTDGKNIARNQ